MPALHPPVVPLDASHHDELVAYFSRDVTAHVFELGLLSRGELASAARGTWTACRAADGALRAVLYARRPLEGGPALSAVPSGEPAAAAILGQRLRRRGGARMVVGARAACDGLWLGMDRPWFRIAYDQRLYVCTAVADGPRLPVVRARPSDVEDLVPMHTEMLREDLGVPPDTIDRFAQWAQLHRTVSAGRMLVVRGTDPDHPLRFCIDVGEPSHHGAQVGGTYVPPAHRGRGVATAAMRGVCHHLLHELDVPRVTLHVHEQNGAAVRCYTRAGFVPDAAFRLMVR